MEDHNHELTENFGAKWFTISSAPPLIFDHNLIVKNAISSLRDKTSKEPIGFELLPPKFTRKQLHNLYESIFNEELDIRNFVNKINSMDILIKLDEKDMSSSRKESYLYKFDQEKYLEKKAQGFDFKI